MTNQRKEKPNRPCIRIFAVFLAMIGHPVFGIDRWPEDETENEIDAIIGPYAVQHTSVDALPDQRKRNAWFSQVINQIEPEFRNKLGFHLAIKIDWHAVQTGQKWRVAHAAIKNWISQDTPSLPDGRYTIGIADVPYPLDVVKGGPIKSDGVFFIRDDPGDDTLGARLHDQLVGRHNKLSVLAAHRKHGKKTLLLLASDDIALMNNVRIGQAFEQAFPTWPDSLDELWFIHQVGQPMISDLQRGQTWLFDDANNVVVEYNDGSFHVYHQNR